MGNDLRDYEAFWVSEEGRCLDCGADRKNGEPHDDDCQVLGWWRKGQKKNKDGE